MPMKDNQTVTVLVLVEAGSKYETKEVNGISLWANLHLLFWLSVVPFVTDWMGENHFTKWPVALYGMVLLMAAIAYTLLSKTLIHNQEKNKKLAMAV